MADWPILIDLGKTPSFHPASIDITSSFKRRKRHKKSRRATVTRPVLSFERTMRRQAKRQSQGGN